MSDQLKEYRIVISLVENETVSCALYEEEKMLGGKARARLSELSSGLDAHLSRLEEGVGNNRRQNRSPEPPPDRSGDLEAAGEKLWELLFAKGPGEALLEILENAEENGPVALGFQLPERDSYRFHRIPWHALKAPGTLPVALMKNVYPYIQASPSPVGRNPPPPPFRMTYAVCLPDEDDDRLDILYESESEGGLDYENEEKRIFDAFASSQSRAPRRFGPPPPPPPVVMGADSGDPAEIRSLAREMESQAIHLTGHGSGGKIVMETPDGKGRNIDGRALAKELLEGLEDLRLVVLSECSSASPPLSGDGSERLWPVAADAARAAGNAVGMIWPVMDHAASVWAEAFYRSLAGQGWSAVVAMGQARRALYALDLEVRLSHRKERENGRETTSPTHYGAGIEWACPAIFSSDPSEVLVDISAPPIKFEPPPSPDLFRWDAARERGFLVGRRQVRKRLVRALLPSQPETPPKSVVLLHGLGGIGKSALAASLATRLAEQGFRPILVSGQINGPALLRTIAYETGNQKLLSLLESPLASSDVSGAGDPNAFRAILSALDECQGYFCLILDDFEYNLEGIPSEESGDDVYPLLPGESFPLSDLSLGTILARLSALPRFRTIITCRYRFAWPGEDAGVLKEKTAEEQLGALTVWEAVKLTLRLPSLWIKEDGGAYSLQEREDLANRLGRHPRALEFLDRLQRSLRKDGGAGFDERPWRIAEKVERRFEEKRREDRDWDRFAQDSDERTRLVLLELVSRDIMLGELLEELNRRTGSPLASLLARRMTVFRQPVEFSAFHIMVADKMRMSGKADPVREWVGCMVDLGLVQKSREKKEQRDLYASPALLSRLLDPAGPEEDPAALHRKAAGYYRQIVASNPDFVSLLRAHQGLMYHCLKAGDGPCAADAAKLLVGFAETNGMFAQARQTARTILDARLAKPPGMAQLAWLVIRSVRCGQIVEGGPSVEGELEGFVEKMKEHAGGRPETLDEESRSLYGALMHLHSQIEYGQGNYEEARRLLKESIEILDALGDRKGRSASLHQLAIIESGQGNYEEARRLLKESIEIKDALGDRQGRSASLHQLAIIEEGQGNYEEARRLLKESIEIKDALGDRQGRSASLHQLAIIEYGQGNYEEARRLLKESIEIKDALGDRQGRSASLHQLAIIEEGQGNYEEARRLLKESIEIMDALGDRQGRSASLHQLAIIEYGQGNYEEARRLLKESIEIMDALGDRQGRSASLHQLAIIEEGQGNYEEARRLLKESIEIKDALGDRQGRSASLHQLAIIEEGQGNYEEARRLLKESIEIKDALGDRQGRATSLAQLGIWCANEGDTEEAKKHLNEALTVFESIDARLEMAQVRSALAPLILNEDPVKGIGLAKMAANDLRGLGHPQAVPAENQYRAMAASVQKAFSEMASQMDEPHPRLIGDLGLSYLFTDEPEKAEPLLKQAMELDGEGPSMATARAALGLALVLKGKGGDQEEASRLEKLAFDIAGRFGETLPDLPGGVSAKDRPETQAANFLAAVAENLFENPEEARTNIQRALAVIDQNPEMSLEANAPLIASRLLGTKTGTFGGLFALNVILRAAPDSAATEILKKGTSGVLQTISEKIRADLKTLTDKRASIRARTMLALSLFPETPDTAKAEANKAMEEAENENLEEERTMAQMVLDLVGSKTVAGSAAFHGGAGQRY